MWLILFQDFRLCILYVAKRTSRIKKIPQSGSSGDINVATIKILVNISKVQDDEVGDGPTSVCAGGGMSEGGGEGDKLEISSADNRGRV